MRNNAVVLTAFAVVVFLAAAAPAAAVTLRVELSNATKGQKLSSYPVNVKVIEASGNKAAASRSTEFRTGPDGALKADVKAGPGDTVTAEVNYRGIEYSSEPIVVKSASEPLAISLPVYDITDDREGVSISERQIFLVPGSEKFLKAYETIVVENTGDRTYVGKFNDKLDVSQVLFIPMPEGYMLNGLSGMPADRIITVNGGLVTRQEIKPGKLELSLGYLVSSDTGLFDFTLVGSREAPETREVTVLFPGQDGWEMKARGLRRAGDYKTEGMTFGLWKGPGEAVRMKIFGPNYVGTTGVWAMTMALSIAGAVAVLLVFRRNIRLWHLARERSRLRSVLRRLEEETPDRESRNYYAPFAKTIKGRLREIERRLGGEHA